MGVLQVVANKPFNYYADKLYEAGLAAFKDDRPQIYIWVSFY
jgi:hypothetical protein